MTKNELINKILSVDKSRSIWKLKRLNKKELNYILKRSMLNNSIIKRKYNDSVPIAVLSYGVKIKTTQTKKMINKEKKILELSMLSGVDYKSLFKEIETKYTIPVDWIIDFYKARGAMPNKKEEKLINDNGVSFALNILKIADNYMGKAQEVISKLSGTAIKSGKAISDLRIPSAITREDYDISKESNFADYCIKRDSNIIDADLDSEDLITYGRIKTYWEDWIKEKNN